MLAPAGHRCRGKGSVFGIIQKIPRRRDRSIIDCRKPTKAATKPQQSRSFLRQATIRRHLWMRYPHVRAKFGSKGQLASKQRKANLLRNERHQRKETMDSGREADKAWQSQEWAPECGPRATRASPARASEASVQLRDAPLQGVATFRPVRGVPTAGRTAEPGIVASARWGY